MLELLIAIGIMVMIVGSLGALARAVQSSAEYSSSCAMVTEQAGVTLERIARMVNEAHANENFPGFVVLEDELGGYRYPDTLVIWHPKGAAANPQGFPLLNELVVICPNPNAPNQLVEITSESDTTPLTSSDPTEVAAAIASFKTSMVLDTDLFSGSNPFSAPYLAVTLTDRLRTCSPSSDPNVKRGAVRFEQQLRLSGGLVASVGLWQRWLRTELQLVPPTTSGNAGTEQPIPFFGSAAVYFLAH